MRQFRIMANLQIYIYTMYIYFFIQSCFLCLGVCLFVCTKITQEHLDRFASIWLGNLGEQRWCSQLDFEIPSWMAKIVVYDQVRVNGGSNIRVTCNGFVPNLVNTYREGYSWVECLIVQTFFPGGNYNCRKRWTGKRNSGNFMSDFVL